MPLQVNALRINQAEKNRAERGAKSNTGTYQRDPE